MSKFRCVECGDMKDESERKQGTNHCKDCVKYLLEQRRSEQ